MTYFDIFIIECTLPITYSFFDLIVTKIGDRPQNGP